MPYIKSDDGRREAMQRGEIAKTAGELNYQLFYYIKHFNKSMDVSQKIETCVQQFLGEKPNYQKYNDMTGALVRCGKELSRRSGTALAHYMQQFLLEIMERYDSQIDIYEDLKIKENGDVE